jgi:hypothetical protein
MRRISGALLAVGAFIGVCGCGGTYYRVTDPTTRHIYYTTELKERGAGSLQLRDAGTGRTVTLQNSEVQNVTKEEFETGKIRSAPADPNGPSGSGSH